MKRLHQNKLDNIQKEVKELHPLLEKLLPEIPNVSRTEYTHGNDEMGADFVLAMNYPAFEGADDYIGVVAKVGKIHQDFSDVERQIGECLEVSRFFKGGREKIRINEVWVIATGVITGGAKNKIHHKYRGQKIRFLDKASLKKWIDKYLPDYWHDVSLEISSYLHSVSTKNRELEQKSSLLPVDKAFYVKQDLFEYSPPVYSTKVKHRRKKPKKVDLFSSLEGHNLILVEGEMGSGKSRLLRRLVESYAQVEMYSESKLLPVYVTYSEMLDDFDNDPEVLIQKKFSKKIRECLKDCVYLLLIDGIDEKKMPADEQFQSLNTLAERVAGNNGIKAVITSRYLKETGNVTLPKIYRCELRPLPLSRILQFVRTLCTNLGVAERIIEDLKKSELFRQLPSTPIAAILLAELINQNSTDLPSNLTELYSKYAELMLGRWEVKKGLVLESQKEYQALDNILMLMAEHIIENGVGSISKLEVKRIAEEYLELRNLDIDLDVLFSKMTERCELLTLDAHVDELRFKHRTFAEFFYAKLWTNRKENLRVDERIFEFYWRNIFFFYVGLLNDCPSVLKEMKEVRPNSTRGRLARIINMGAYFLAAYTTPYEVISSGINDIMVDAAHLYKDIIDGRMEQNPLSKLPRLHVLFFIQLFVRTYFSYKFFAPAFEDSALSISDSDLSPDLRAYALFFTNVAYIEMGQKDSFDFLLENHEALPLDIALALDIEAKDFKNRTRLMRRQDKRLRKIIKGNLSVQAQIEKMFGIPIDVLNKPV